MKVTMQCLKTYGCSFYTFTFTVFPKIFKNQAHT